jgi:hypothetical protein
MNRRLTNRQRTSFHDCLSETYLIYLSWRSERDDPPIDVGENIRGLSAEHPCSYLHNSIVLVLVKRVK